MRLFGFDLEIGKGCPDCERLERENASLRLQMGALGDLQVEMLDELRALKEADRGRKVMFLRNADLVLGLADLKPATVVK